MAEILDQKTLELDEGLLADVLIQFKEIDDQFEKAIARYEYPYADGADLEDMGQKAHTVRFRCYFWDDAEQQSYDTHTELLDALEDKDLLDFVHPKYGLMQGKIESISVRHDDDRERCAILDISFIEQMPEPQAAEAAQSVNSAVEDSYATGQDEFQDKMGTSIKDALPTADAGIVGKTLDTAKGLLEQAQEYSNTTRQFVGKVEGYLATAEAVVNQVASPINTLQATITYATTLPGRIIGPIANVVEKLAITYNSLRSTPSLFISNLDTAFDDLLDSFEELADDNDDTTGASTVMGDCVEIACAQRIALEAAAVYAADEAAVQEGSASPSVIYANAAQAADNDDTEDTQDVQVMTIRELEETLAIVRTRLEAAVVKAREMESLKTMAASLLEHVNRVRLEREKMITVRLDNAMPLHLVCLKYGLPYTDAERLLRVNRGIKNPNFTAGEIQVYVRQD